MEGLIEASQQALESTQFWLAYGILAYFLGAKFAEMGSLAEHYDLRARTFSGVGPKDFAGSQRFYAGLIVYLLLGWAAFLVLVVFMPFIVRGVPGFSVPTGTASESTPFYVAAILMGISKSPFPQLTFIADFQRNILHGWIGIPDKALESATKFFSHIVAKSTKDDSTVDVSEYLTRLLSMDSRINIANFADTNLYRSQIKKMRLDGPSEIKDLCNSSSREQISTLEQLIDTLTIAAVRRSGLRGLTRVADFLEVPSSLVADSPKNPELDRRIRFVWTGVLIAIVLLSGLVVLIAYLDHWMASNDFQRSKVWPEGQNGAALLVAQYIVPLFLSVIVAGYLFDSKILSRRLKTALEFSIDTFQDNIRLVLWLFVLNFTFALLIVFLQLGLDSFTVPPSEFISYWLLPLITQSLAIVIISGLAITVMRLETRLEDSHRERKIFYSIMLFSLSSMALGAFVAVTNGLFSLVPRGFVSDISEMMDLILLTSVLFLFSSFVMFLFSWRVASLYSTRFLHR